jgi:AmiR/NasT family two-component response regulator
MTSALIYVNGLQGPPMLGADLEAAGIHVLAVVQDCSKLVQAAVRHAPDVVICDAPQSGSALFAATQVIAQTAPCPVIVFTSDADAGAIAQSTESGIHAYVVNGYGANRLRPLIHLAQARFQHEQGQRAALQDISVRFEERKMVDRAKGILMHARGVSDDDAFHILRTASMHTNQRLGQVSQHIIHSAHFAEAVNRSGQLRMLSQRLVKLHWLRLAGVDAANLAHLEKILSQPTYGDLLAQVVQTWARLKPVLLGTSSQGQAGSEPAVYTLADDLAELLLQGAERLTASLEGAGLTAPLKVLNIAGRQRMLSQRFAKCAVLAVRGAPNDGPLAQRAEAGMAESRAAFEQSLTYLNGLPLSTPEIRSLLEAAGIGWLQMLAAFKDARRVAAPQQMARLEGLAAASEKLLDGFESLSAHYERGMHLLAGS